MRGSLSSKFGEIQFFLNYFNLFRCLKYILHIILLAICINYKYIRYYFTIYYTDFMSLIYKSIHSTPKYATVYVNNI